MWRCGTVDHMEGYYGSVIYAACCHTHVAKRVEMEGAKSHQEQEQEEQEEPGAKDEHKGSPSAHGWIHNSMAKHLRKCLTAKVFPLCCFCSAVLKVPNN